MKSTYTHPYQADVDYAQIRRLLSDNYILAGPPVYCTVGDLDWWRCLEDDPQAVSRAQLGFTEEERLVAFIWLAWALRRLCQRPGVIRQPGFIKLRVS